MPRPRLRAEPFVLGPMADDYRPHALGYLLMCRDHDHDARAVFQSPVPGRQLRLQRIARAAQFYRVARTLHRKPDDKATASDDRLAHYEKLLDVLDALPHNLPARGYVAAVETAETSITEAYGLTHRLTSLASKFLWLRFGSPILIYDSQARAALKMTTNDLSEFEDRWRRQFAHDAKRIEHACRELPRILDFVARSPNEHTQLRSAIDSPGFRERVLDHALWRVGAPVSA